MWWEGRDANQTSKVTAKLEKRNAIFFMLMQMMRNEGCETNMATMTIMKIQMGFKVDLIVLWANPIELPHLGLMMFCQ